MYRALSSPVSRTSLDGLVSSGLVRELQAHANELVAGGPACAPRGEGELVAWLLDSSARLRAQVAGLLADNQQLRVELVEMQTFLADHGLVWVGGPPGSRATSPGTAADSGQPDPAQPAQDAMPCELEELAACVEELNASQLADGGPQLPVLSLTVFSDGLQLGQAWPARPWGDATTLAILTDLLEGFLPSVLRQDFPQGAILQLQDRSSERLAAATSRSASPSKLRDLQDCLAADASAGLLGRALVSRLPKQVVRGGLIVAVQSPVAAHLQPDGGRGGSPSRVLVSSPSPSPGSKPGSHEDSSPDAAALEQEQTEQVVTLQVRSEDGQQTLVLKLPGSASIGAVRASIDRHRAAAARSGGSQQVQEAAASYELRSRDGLLADEEQTLSGAGLAPSATLFMRRC